VTGQTPARGRKLEGVRDPDGYAALGDYGVLGDGRGVALVALDGSVDWWAAPHLDSTPAFAALLDPARGGRIQLHPCGQDAAAEHHYVAHSNQLQTVFTTAAGQARVTDSLNTGNAGALPWSELARQVDGLAGTVEFTLIVQPGDGLGAWQPWAERDQGAAILHAGQLTLAVLAPASLKLDLAHDRVEARFTVAVGERVVLGVAAAERDPLYLCGTDSIEQRVTATADSWRQWCGQVRWTGEGRERIVRSALALKTLIMARTGAVAAAATTSLPERVGGPKNWDYRFSWIRDAALTVNALAVLGLHEEVHAAVAWLLHAIRDNGPDVHVLYTLDGQLPGQMRRPPVPGYRHSQPVNLGNRAAGQRQLGVYGDLFGTVADWVFGGHVLDVRSARELSDLADQCADTWRRDDAGLWELTADRAYTSSKMNCWRALDAAARLAEAGQLTGTGRRWRGEAELIRRWVNEHCWSGRKHAYTFYAGTEDLDASVMLGAEFGFDRSQRMTSTIDAVTAELSAGPLLYRYTGAYQEEQTFVACAYWRVHALSCVGRLDEARQLFRQLDELVPSPLGLMAEMSVAGTGEPLGNLPQALSHLAHIRAASALRHAETKGARTP
jgi:GH15 family glucan-1,4-alpha-glucosidase